MKKIAIEMSIDLRKAFKSVCALNDESMKDVVVEEVTKILIFDEPCYSTSRPKNGDGMCVLCLNMDESFLEDIKDRKETKGDKIRDIYITSIINYLQSNNSDYDYSNDINEG